MRSLSANFVAQTDDCNIIAAVISQRSNESFRNFNERKVKSNM